MGPGHTAELDSFKHIWKLFGTIDFHKLDRHPVWATGTQTIGKMFTIFTECVTCGTGEKSNSDGDAIPSPAHCPLHCRTKLPVTRGGSTWRGKTLRAEPRPYRRFVLWPWASLCFFICKMKYWIIRPLRCFHFLHFYNSIGSSVKSRAYLGLLAYFIYILKRTRGKRNKETAFRVMTELWHTMYQNEIGAIR